ncbi:MULTISPECIES: H-NS family histone-like protein [unclassified Providencia]|uniref:H-NS family histone-like protein n=1 Tax=unclassified Providencia TaxID=2633465 RepID=UPI00234AF7EA|nr:MULTISPECIES: H-NS family nucleoid-associated regulatory protein [unclassified Providencia]
MSLTTEQEYEITAAIMGSVSSIRKFAKEKDISWLKAAYDKFGAIIQEREEEEALLELERQEIENKKIKLLELAQQMGIDPTIISFDEKGTKKPKKMKIAKAKYRFINPLTNKEETYSGQGRMKKGLKLLIEQGHTLEEFLIDKNDNEENI